MPPASEMVANQTSLDACCARWREAGLLAFDTEFIRDDTFHAQLCLVQVAAGDEVVLVDPLADNLDLTPFWELIADDEIVTVVHAGKEDFELCLTESGQPPRRVFDVQIAAGLAGYDYPMSLSRLVDAVLRQRVAKGQTMTDWSRRPLAPEQLRYAVDDVAYLLRVYAKLQRRLKSRGRLAWAQEEFERFEDPLFYRPPSEDRVLKIKGAKRLDQRGLAALAGLIAWRERFASERDRPIRQLVRDDVLVEIAKRRPTGANELSLIRGFHLSRNAKQIEDVLVVVRAAEALPAGELPERYEPREETPMMRAVTDVLSAVLRSICWENGVSQELVGSQQRLRELVDWSLRRVDEKPALLTGWRGKLVGEALIELLAGRSELHLTGWPDAPRLDVVMKSAAVDAPQTSHG